MAHVRDSILGSVLGSTIGDALGAPVEGLSQREIAMVYGQLRDPSQVAVFYSELPAHTNLTDAQRQKYLANWQPVGLYTDDTQQAMLAIEVLIETGHADREAYARRIVQCLADRNGTYPLGPFRGWGPGFEQVAQRLLAGADADHAGIDSAGNGAAMRVYPVGLYFRREPLRAGIEAAELSLLTHHDIRAILSASAVAIATAICCQPPSLSDPKPFMDSVLASLDPVCEHLTALPAFADAKSKQMARDAIVAFSIVSDCYNDSYATARRNIASHGSRSAGRDLPAEHPFCLCSVPAAFWHFLRHRFSLEEAIVSAINAGGDADTIGCITGALAGAIHGCKSIPEQWLRRMKNRRQIELRAEALAGDKDAASRWDDFRQMENRLNLNKATQWANIKGKPV